VWLAVPVLLVLIHWRTNLSTRAPAVLGDGRYRGIDAITTARTDHTGRIIHDQHY